jgi:predicted DNA-binding transcriptional regulator AlpA
MHKKRYPFRPRPTQEDRNVDLREVCSIRGRGRSSTIRDVAAGLIPAPFKIRGKNYWRLSWILAANDHAAAGRD